MGQAWEESLISGGGLWFILAPFLDLAVLHGTAWICTSSLGDANLSSPIGQAKALLGLRGKPPTSSSLVAG